jgi:hypothetical protein
MQYLITIAGYDEYGRPKLEMVKYTEPPKLPWWRQFLAYRIFVGPLWNIGYKLGLHSIRRISSIHLAEEDK